MSSQSEDSKTEASFATLAINDHATSSSSSSSSSSSPSISSTTPLATVFNIQTTTAHSMPLPHLHAHSSNYVALETIDWTRHSSPTQLFALVTGVNTEADQLNELLIEAQIEHKRRKKRLNATLQLVAKQRELLVKLLEGLESTQHDLVSVQIGEQDRKIRQIVAEERAAEEAEGEDDDDEEEDEEEDDEEHEEEDEVEQRFPKIISPRASQPDPSPPPSITASSSSSSSAPSSQRKQTHSVACGD